MKADARSRRAFRFQLDLYSGVPIYRQIIDQVTAAIAAGSLGTGDQLPTVRQLAVDLEINPNTVIRAYRELEIRGVLKSQQGTGTFISGQEPGRDNAERRRRLAQIVREFLARGGAEGFTLDEMMEQLTNPEDGAENGG